MTSTYNIVPNSPRIVHYVTTSDIGIVSNYNRPSACHALPDYYILPTSEHTPCEHAESELTIRILY